MATRIATGKWFPSPSSDGLWFYSGIVMLLLYAFLVEPFFTRPADATVNAATGEIALLCLYSDALQADRSLLLAVKLGLGYMIFVLIVSLATMLLKDAEANPLVGIKGFTWELATQFGSARIVFSVVFLTSIFFFPYLQSWRGVLIFGVWWLIISVQPIETILAGIQSFIAPLRGTHPGFLGMLRDRVTPGHAHVWLTDTEPISQPKLVAMEDGKGSAELGLLISSAQTLGKSCGRVACLGLKATAKELGFPARIAMGDECRVIEVDEKQLPGNITGQLLGLADYRCRGQLTGFVSTNTDVKTLRFEVTSITHDLREGALVTVDISGKPVFYQIVNGLTREEIVAQTNERGYVIAEAEKVGLWDKAGKGFRPSPWLPAPYAPVCMHDFEAPTDEEQQDIVSNSVGIVPGSKYTVQLDPHQLVTHNTAILGILGAGKTTLARELVHRVAASKVKVLCIDPTGEYAGNLEGLDDEDYLNRLREVVEKQCAPVQDRCVKNRDEGGSLPVFQNLANLWVGRFVGEKCKSKLVVVNPLAFSITKQISFVDKDGKAEMRQLTAVEITRVLTEACLNAVRDTLSTEARLCVVFEEAHSLIPEWNSVAADGDQVAAMGTARAILQGRKHGLGCLLITQRTANVIKSILNQCNTVVAMRIYDATGMEFLSNYIGAKYASVLSTLLDYHAVVFGRASSSTQPLIVQLNDPTVFLKSFYKEVDEGQVGDKPEDPLVADEEALPIPEEVPSIDELLAEQE